MTWYPRLSHGTPKERAHWHIIGSGEGIHWPDLDEDISVENMISSVKYAFVPGFAKTSCRPISLEFRVPWRHAGEGDEEDVPRLSSGFLDIRDGSDSFIARQFY